MDLSPSKEFGPRQVAELGLQLFEASGKEGNPILAEEMRESAKYLFKCVGESILPAHMEIKVSDINITKDSQVAAIGSGAKVEGSSFIQVNTNSADDLDMGKLVQELGALSQKILEGGASPQNIAAAGAVATAQMAAQNNDSKGIIEAISKAGENALEVAQQIGAYEAAEVLRRSGVATEDDRARIELWASHLPLERFLVQEEKLGGLAQTRILSNLQRYGLCLIRPVGMATIVEVVESVIPMIGKATAMQNEAEGPIKDIRPKPDIDPNTGDSKGDLGFHVDGTQHLNQPPVLLFQYATGATLGAHSKFADIAKILRDISPERRHRLLVNLARHDAATFTKGKGRYQGPIFSFSSTGALICRIRFDAVINVNPACKEDFELLREKFDDEYYPTVFQPLDGDIVVFDNWRVMHARTEVYGTRDRHHRRVWFENLKLEHQPTCYLGIRPISREVAAEIERQNRTN